MWEEDKMKYCPGCGAKLRPSDKFCISCGYRMKKTNSLKYFLIVIGIVAVLVLGFFITDYFLSRPSTMEIKPPEIVEMQIGAEKINFGFLGMPDSNQIVAPYELDLSAGNRYLTVCNLESKTINIKLGATTSDLEKMEISAIGDVTNTQKSETMFHSLEPQKCLEYTTSYNIAKNADTDKAVIRIEAITSEGVIYASKNIPIIRKSSAEMEEDWRQREEADKLTELEEKMSQIFPPEAVTEEDKSICAFDARFSILNVCREKGYYRITISNDGEYEIARWDIVSYESPEEIDAGLIIGSVGPYAIDNIKSTYPYLHNLKKIELVANPWLGDRAIRCYEDFESYGDEYGEPFPDC